MYSSDIIPLVLTDKYAEDNSQNNPLYFGTSTLLSSSSGTMRPFTNSTTMPPPAPAPRSSPRHLHEYADLSHNAVDYNTFESNGGEEPHYECIPAQQLNENTGGGGGGGGGGVGVLKILSSGHYENLKPPQSRPEEMALMSGKYDQLDKPEAQEENPYVMGPNAHAARKEMYTLLPSPEELKKLSGTTTTKKYT